MFKLRNLIKFRNNPKITNKIINNLEISKEDKKNFNGRFKEYRNRR